MPTGALFRGDRKPEERLARRVTSPGIRSALKTHPRQPIQAARMKGGHLAVTIRRGGQVSGAPHKAAPGWWLSQRTYCQTGQRRFRRRSNGRRRQSERSDNRGNLTGIERHSGDGRRDTAGRGRKRSGKPVRKATPGRNVSKFPVGHREPRPRPSKLILSLLKSPLCC